MTRRTLLAALAAAASALLARHARAAVPPKESGLSHEGLLAGHPGFQPRSSLPLPHEELPGFLSRAQLAEHYREYLAAVTRLRTAEDALRGETPEGGAYADLRRTQVAAANSVLLHELYFGGLAPQTVTPPGYIEAHMNEHMGSLASWREDFTKCALAARAWAVLVYDPYDDRWHNAVMDSDNDGVWVGANPLVICDVAGHAYSIDYPRREDYVERFLAHIDWEEIARRYRAVDRM